MEMIAKRLCCGAKLLGVTLMVGFLQVFSVPSCEPAFDRWAGLAKRREDAE